MNKLTPREQAELTVQMMKKRKEAKLKGQKEADKFRSGGGLNNINKHNKRFY